jgi:hypothetical protein
LVIFKDLRIMDDRTLGKNLLTILFMGNGLIEFFKGKGYAHAESSGFGEMDRFHRGRFGLRWYEKGDGRREEDGVRSTQCAGKKSKK